MADSVRQVPAHASLLSLPRACVWRLSWWYAWEGCEAMRCAWSLLFKNHLPPRRVWLENAWSKTAKLCFFGTPVLSLWASSIDSVCGSFAEAKCALHLRTSSTLSWLLHVSIQIWFWEGFVVKFSHHHYSHSGFSLRPLNEACSCYAKASMTETETCCTQSYTYYIYIYIIYILYGYNVFHRPHPVFSSIIYVHISEMLRTFQRCCARVRDVVHVSQQLCTFHRSCARASQKLCTFHRSLITFVFNCIHPERILISKSIVATKHVLPIQCIYISSNINPYVSWVIQLTWPSACCKPSRPARVTRLARFFLWDGLRETCKKPRCLCGF